MVMLGVNVAVIHDGRLLLTQREDFEVWCMPGGGVEDGESVAHAAVREVHEETGLHVELTRLVGIYSRPLWMGRGYHIVVFVAQPTARVLRPQVDEVLDVRFFDPQALPTPLLWGQHQRIIDALSGVGGSVARAQQVPPQFEQPMTRQALYEMRDRSGLSKSQFYLQYVEHLGPEDQRMEVGEQRQGKD